MRYDDLLASVGLVTPVRRGYEGPGLELLRLIHQARVAGLGDLFSPAVIAPYLDPIRKLVALELDLFRLRVDSAAARPDGSVGDLARAANGLVERLLVVVRRQLLQVAVKPRGKRRK